MMMVLVDTSVWSFALRRENRNLSPARLSELITSFSVVMIGPVRQELLTGIANEEKFTDLKNKLRAFDDFPVTTNDYETAAHFKNICRKNGVQGSNTDFLICAVSYNNGFSIYTYDNDFYGYSKHLPIELFQDNTD